MKYERVFKTYPNGARLILTKTPDFYTSKFGVTFLVGSENEDIENGISHLLEHEMFKGTKNYTQKQLAEEFVKISARQNASTGCERTHYHCTLPQKHLKRGIELFSEMIFDSTFDADLLEKEKQVVLEEIKLNQDKPERLSFIYFFKEMYKGIGLSKSVIGEADKMLAITREELVAFKEKYYTAKNCIMSVIGDYNIEQIDEWVQKYFVERLPQTTNKNRKIFSPTIQNKGTKIEIFKDNKQTYGIIGFNCPFSYDDRAYEKVNLINFVLGKTMNSRLFERIRNQLSLVYNIYSGVGIFKNNIFLNISFNTSAEKEEIAKKEILKEVKKIHTEGITNEEFKRVKDMIISSFLMNQDMPNSGLTHVMYTNELFDADKYEQRLKKLTKKECEDAFRKYIDIDNAVEIYVGPNAPQ